MSPEEVLRSYAAQDVAPPLIGADEVLATARTRVRRGRVQIVALAGLATLLVLAGVAFALPSPRPDRGLPAVPPSGSPSARVWPPAVTRVAPPLACTPSALPELAGTTPDARWVTTVDPSGTWIVGVAKTGLLIWHGNEVSNPAAGRLFVPRGVNATGTIGGYEVLADNSRAAALFRDGKVTRLPLPPNTTTSEVVAVDASGDALGTVNAGDSGSLAASQRVAGRQALLWPASGGMIPLTAPPGMAAVTAEGFGTNATVIGNAEDGNRTRPYRWNLDGTGTALDGPIAELSGVGGDWAVGPGAVGADRKSYGPPRPSDPASIPIQPHVRWNMRTGTADAMGEFQAAALAANGWAFGVRDFTDFHPAVWRDGTVTTLPLRNPARKDLAYGGGMSADGHTIVATTRAGRDGPMDITRWTC